AVLARQGQNQLAGGDLRDARDLKVQLLPLPRRGTIEAADHRDRRVTSNRDAGDRASYCGCTRWASRSSTSKAVAADRGHCAVERSQALAADTALTVRPPWRREAVGDARPRHEHRRGHSIWHVLEQPSPLTLLPSSHFSPAAVLRWPSPHW